MTEASPDPEQLRQLAEQFKATQQLLREAKKLSKSTGGHGVPQVVHVEFKPSVVDDTLRYWETLKRLPYELLLAHYRRDVCAEPPRCNRAWLVESATRDYQRKRYIEVNGAIPESVLRADQNFAIGYRPWAVPEDWVDPDEPTVELSVPTEGVRLVLTNLNNPFSSGITWTIWEILRHANSIGVTHDELAFKLRGLLPKLSEGVALDEARCAFARFLRKRWAKLVLVE